MTIAKEPIWRKLKLENKTTEQVMKIRYLWTEIISNKNVGDKVREEIVKANKIVNDKIYNNTNLKKKNQWSKDAQKSHKTTIGIYCFTAETRTKTTETKRLLETSEMKTLRKVEDITLPIKI